MYRGMHVQAAGITDKMNRHQNRACSGFSSKLLPADLVRQSNILLTERRSMKRIPVFFCPEMIAVIESYSPSAEKPAALIEQWLLQGQPVDIRAPVALSREDFYRVHYPPFVDGVLSLKRCNGFGNRSAAVAASVPFTAGAMLSAAREAIANDGVAIAPCSGFHHACYSRNGSYCTLNGLMAAAAALKAEGLCSRVGILDCDHHYGNGTDDIIRRLGLDWVQHYTAGSKYREPDQADDFLQQLPDIVRSFAKCEVLLYQAGADPHIEDPLGGWLTTAQLQTRDQIVFSTARDLGLPVAWNLAGGYQDPLSKVLEIHTNTLQACIDVYLAPADRVCNHKTLR